MVTTTSYTEHPSGQGSNPSPVPVHDVARWMAVQRNAMATPDEITSQLIANGWDADAAARASLRSLRSSDRHTLNYAALTIASGLAALGAATLTHQLIDGNRTPDSLTRMLTMTIVAIPIAVITGYYAWRAERTSPFVMWSPSRRGWFGALAFCTGSVGIVRLTAYVHQTLSTLTGASPGAFSWPSAAQVLVSMVISVPLFVWSFVQWRRSNLLISALGSDR